MSKRDLAKLRRRLEQPSQKTRRSTTDLRRSLGRRSVGDISNTDLAAFEQVSQTSSDDSCHLNPDSEVIDENIFESPWHKHLDNPLVVVSEESICNALLKDKTPLFADDSNVENLNLGSFNKRDISKILSPSVVANKAEVDRVKRTLHRETHQEVRSSIESVNASLESPKLKLSTLRRGLRVQKKSRQKSHDDYNKALDDMDSEQEPDDNKNKISLRPLKTRHARGPEADYNEVVDDSDDPEEPLNNTTELQVKSVAAMKDDVASGIDTNQADRPFETSDSSLLLPAPKKSKLRIRAMANRRSVMPAVDYNKILDDTDDSRKSLNETRKSNVKSPLAAKSHNVTSGVATKQAERPLETSDSSLLLPAPKTSKLRVRAMANRRSVMPAVDYNKFLDDTNDSQESFNKTSKSRVKSPLAAERDDAASGVDTKQAERPLETSDSSLLLPAPKKSKLRVRAMANRRSVMPAVDYNKFLDDTDDSRKSLNETRKSNVKSPLAAKSHNVTSGVDTKQAEGPLETSDSSLLLPAHKKSELRVRAMANRRSFMPAVDYNKILDDTDDSRKSLNETRKSNVKSPLAAKGHNVTSGVDTKQAGKPLETSDSSLSLPAPKKSKLRVRAMANRRSVMPAVDYNEILNDSDSSAGLKQHAQLCRKNNIAQSTNRNEVNRSGEEAGPLDLSERKTHLPTNGRQERLQVTDHDETNEATFNLSLVSRDETLPLGAEAMNLSGVDQDVPIQHASNSNTLPECRTGRLSSLRKSVQMNNSVMKEDSKAEGRHGISKKHKMYVTNKHQLSPQNDRDDILPTNRSLRKRSSTFSTNLSLESKQSKIDNNQTKSLTLTANVEGGMVKSSSGGFTSPKSALLSLRNRESLTHPASDDESTRFRHGETPVYEGLSSALASDTVVTFRALSLGSDSVFKSSKPLSTSNASNNEIPPSNVPEVQRKEESWTENPYIDITPDSLANDAEPEASDEELSSIQGSDDSEVHLHSSALESSHHQRNLSANVYERTFNEKSHPSRVGTSNSPLENSTITSGNMSHRHSSTNEPQLETEPSYQKSNGNNSVFSPIAGSSKQQETKTSFGSKVGNAKDTQKPEDTKKMQEFFKHFMEDAKNNKYKSKHVPETPSTTVNKPSAPAPKSQAKKKPPCPYFGDYRPPKRIKPRPYVTAKMYKFLEAKLKVKFGLEARIRAEDFVSYLCETVTSVTRRKSKYHKLVFELRDKMASLGLISTQFEFHLFIEDYLPMAFRYKSIPCYGCPKGPTLDVEDEHAPLPVKKNRK